MKNKKSIKYYKTIICVFSVFVLIMGVYFAAQYDSAAKAIGRFDPPVDTVSKFFEEYCSGNYEGMDKYIYGVETLGLSGDHETAYGEKVLGMLSSELEYKLLDEVRRDGGHAMVRAEVKYIDLPASAETLKELVDDELITALKAAPEGIDLTDRSENNTRYYEEVVLPALEKATDRLVAEEKMHKSSQILEIELIYSGSSWKIAMSDELQQVMLGGMS